AMTRGRHLVRLVDTGRFSALELEWLISQGADIYTSDEVRTDVREVETLNAAAKKGKAVLAFFVRKSWDEKGAEASWDFSDLLNLARSGVYLHVSNREDVRDFRGMEMLADACRAGGGWLVSYHHGPLDPQLIRVAENGAWIHVSDRSFGAPESEPMIEALIRAALAAGSNLVVHWEKGMSLLLLEEVVRKGAIVLLPRARFDFKSPYRKIERRCRRQKLDFRAYYLAPSVLP
ncbi:MAG: hypothetical protein ACE5LV_04795, partial [Candidatus Aminicenantales bacterium]